MTWLPSENASQTTRELQKTEFWGRIFGILKSNRGAVWDGPSCAWSGFAQIRIGMTTYLKSALSGMVIRADELAS
ncbi:hypothetical protein ABTE11_23410, partial [Acinetobacter baumannii]